MGVTRRRRRRGDGPSGCGDRERERGRGSSSSSRGCSAGWSERGAEIGLQRMPDSADSREQRSQSEAARLASACAVSMLSRTLGRQCLRLLLPAAAAAAVLSHGVERIHG